MANLQRAQEAAREARVGWRIGDGGDVDPDWIGRLVKYQVPFRPGETPPMTEEPSDLPNGDVLLYPAVSFAEVQQRYDEASWAITRLNVASPALFGLARDGSSEATGAFAADPDAGRARDRAAGPLRRVLADISATRASLGDDLDPLDLTPLHRQLYGRAVWAGGFRHRVAETAARGRTIARIPCCYADRNAGRPASRPCFKSDCCFPERCVLRRHATSRAGSAR
ncbi:hypothetical protein OG792_20875 [Micromonospora sp. NBC_01699]|uniref:hypothetical protein n=1 Tax=Micromonospora sp. NBC_01699 TaxID=2975984 RepID=UPI002E29B846|nr:hypothetical protein [Micromonospora sp. NBC_01699]